jgi:hypothetical protein
MFLFIFRCSKIALTSKLRWLEFVTAQFSATKLDAKQYSTKLNYIKTSCCSSFLLFNIKIPPWGKSIGKKFLPVKQPYRFKFSLSKKSVNTQNQIYFCQNNYFLHFNLKFPIWWLLLLKVLWIQGQINILVDSRFIFPIFYL